MSGLKPNISWWVNQNGSPVNTVNLVSASLPEALWRAKKPQKILGLIFNHTLFFCHLTAICDFNNRGDNSLHWESFWALPLRAQGMLLKTCYSWPCTRWECAGVLGTCIPYGITQGAGVMSTLQFQTDYNDQGSAVHINALFRHSREAKGNRPKNTELCWSNFHIIQFSGSSV